MSRSTSHAPYGRLIALAAAGLLMAAGCAGGVQTPTAIAGAHIAVANRIGLTIEPRIDRKAILHPAHKYFGISLANAPQAVVGPIAAVTRETGKQPNMLMYYQSWDRAAVEGHSNFNVVQAKNTCKDGLIPMLTWQSWDAQDKTKGHGVAVVQPTFSIARIADGDFDRYIRATARAIASINCPLALRFDQEQNGFWYPWGISNTAENGSRETRTAHEYVRMWRHVRRIFAAQGASNVLWVWSPNVQDRYTTLPPLRASYPGSRWVDWIGIDGYYSTSTATFHTLFGPTMTMLRRVAPNKPWMISETAVGAGRNKPTQIKNLLRSAARNPRIDGLVYFDQHKATDRAYWPFQQTAASLNAFRRGIGRHVYASGRPGGMP
jgi:Glycosyl hydrolase family 26